MKDGVFFVKYVFIIGFSLMNFSSKVGNLKTANFVSPFSIKRAFISSLLIKMKLPKKSIWF